MAYVKVTQIKTTLGKALAYIVRPEATDGGRLVSTNAAVIDPGDAQALTAQYEASQAQQVGRGRKGTVLAHHVVQSFDHDEASPELANRLGVELAERITKGRFEYTVATQIDSDNVHNHIMINSVSFVDGRKLRVDRDSLRTWRVMSDVSVREHGLSVIQPRESSPHKSIGQLYAEARGDSPQDVVRLAVDRACAASHDWSSFEKALQSQGVRVERSRKHFVTFQGFGMKHAQRDFRFGPGYTEQEIMARLGRSETVRFDAHDSLVKDVRGDRITLRLPGSGGTRYIMVNAQQVVRHGQTLRVYLPAKSQQAILNREGLIVAQVPTNALYVAFAPPTRAMMKGGLVEDAATLRAARRVRQEVSKMHQTERGVEVRTREGITDAEQAVVRAVELSERAERVAERVQTLVVAWQNSEKESAQHEDLAVQIRSTRREGQELERDVEALMEWASKRDDLAVPTFDNLTRAERLKEVHREDMQAVRPPVVTPVDREGREEQLPDFASMTLAERATWARNKARREQAEKQTPNRSTRTREER